MWLEKCRIITSARFLVYPHHLRRETADDIGVVRTRGAVLPFPTRELPQQSRSPHPQFKNKSNGKRHALTLGLAGRMDIEKHVL